MECTDMDAKLSEPIEISLNAKARTTTARTIGDLLAELELTRRQVSVILNERVQRRATRAEVPLHPGDHVEIIAMVGGG